MLALHAIVGAFAVFMLARYGPAALLFVAPALRRPAVSPPAPPRSIAEERMREELEALGFRHIGSLAERGPAGALAEEFAVLAAADGTAWADVAAGTRGAWVRLVSAAPDGAVLVTALPDATAAGALAAHRKGVEPFRRAHGGAAAPPDLGARLEAAGRWARGPGRGAVRGATAMSFVNAALAALLLATSVTVLAFGLKS
jgi:hypothetical protein